jgi:ribose 5-phosphate isomerase A
MDPKENAAREALKLVRSKMVVGLGTGSTAAIFIKLLGEKAKEEKIKVRCVPTSFESRRMAVENGLDVFELDQVEGIDIAIDGADLVTEELYAIKGKGGALSREKIIGYNAKKFVLIVDSSKMGDELNGIVPIEVLPFAYPFVMRELKKKGIPSMLRTSLSRSGPVITDNNNFILDAKMAVEAPEEMEGEINGILGVVENGIFTKVSGVIVGYEDSVKVIEK